MPIRNLTTLQARSTAASALPSFTAATLIYIVITLTVIFFMRWLERRVAVPGYISQAAH